MTCGSSLNSRLTETNEAQIGPNKIIPGIWAGDNVEHGLNLSAGLSGSSLFTGPANVSDRTYRDCERDNRTDSQHLSFIFLGDV